MWINKYELHGLFQYGLRALYFILKWLQWQIFLILALFSENTGLKAIRFVHLHLNHVKDFTETQYI
jgi:hypothetical protein